MHTIPIDDIDTAHAEAVLLRAKLRGLHNEHPGPNDLSDLCQAGLVDIICGETDPIGWFITDAGLRWLGIQSEPAVTYRVRWKHNGANRADWQTGLTLEAARKEVKFAVGQMRAGYPIADITVVDETTDEDATADVGRGLIPHAEELEKLEHRAATIGGLADLIDYLRGHPELVVPRYPRLSEVFSGVEDSIGRDIVYVAAAALGVAATSHETRFGGIMTIAERNFGPVEYTVTHLGKGNKEGYAVYNKAGNEALAGRQAAQNGTGQ